MTLPSPPFNGTPKQLAIMQALTTLLQGITTANGYAVDLTVGGFTVPVPWLQSLDGLAPAILTPLVVFFWRWQAGRGREPNLYVKLAIGCLIFAAAVVWLAVAP